ncbi:MAG: amidohydrolase, partial [Oscillospiraceae bacterium]
MLITNAKIIPMIGSEISNGFIHTVNGKITAIDEMQALASHHILDNNSVDCTGLTLYPGFIDAHCHLGMWEEGLDFEGDDGNEMTDPVTPQLRAIDAINPMSDSFPEAVAAG